VPGWRRNRGGLQAADPAVLSPDRPREDWHTLPPLPTVLRTPTMTVAVGAFNDSLSTWHNPSFLSPLGHQIDRDGPAGLITGIAGASASPEPSTDHHDQRPAVAEGVPAPLQRSVTSWRPPMPARSSLMTAPDVDLGPVSVRTLTVGPWSTERTSTDPVIATDQEAESAGMHAESPDIPAARSQTSPTYGAVSTDFSEVPASGETSADDREGVALPRPQSLVSDLGSSRVVAQRQVEQNAPHTPQRRLGLGAPLSDPPAGFPARAERDTQQPVVARFPDGPAPRDSGVMRPHLPQLLAPAAGSPADSADAPERARAPQSVQRTLADQRSADDLASHSPIAAKAATPVRQPSPQAPLTGDFQARYALRPAETPLVKTATSMPSADHAAIQRLEATPRASPGNLDQRSPAPAAGPQLPADRQPTIPLKSDPGTADKPAHPPDRLQSAAQRLADVAPLLGDLQPLRMLDVRSGASTGLQPAPASMIPDAPRSPPVQRSVPARSAVARPDAMVRGSEAGHSERPGRYADPGAIAVARGLARRDFDGSVVFDLGPSPVLHDPSELLLPRPDESAGWPTPAGSQQTVQRQEATEPAETAAPPPENGPASTMPVPSAAPNVSATAAAAAAPGAALPPLEELARQLFGPLTARLKAELRLDRERAGLLTDLRQ
jgi:hypothetical protein